jgi:uncharacterized membrane protein YfcA
VPEINIILFLVLVAGGALVQTITGFAMGLIIIAGVTALDIAEISFSAAVISFISLANAAVALRHNHRHIDFHYLKWVSIGLVPMLVVGFVLLDYFSAQYYDLLKKILGIVIIGAGVMLMITPAPYKNQSSKLAIGSCGLLGGLIAGFYSAGGAPLAYFMYRQPVELNIIRSTLLAIFAVSTIWRTIIAGIGGHLNVGVLIVAGVSIPVVVIVTMLTGRVVHRVPDKLVRRMVFILLIGVGAFLIVR